MTAFHKELAAILRARGVSEPELARILEGVDEMVSDSGRPPEELFGPARAYAESFPDSGSRGLRSRSAAVVLLTLVISLSTLALLLDLTVLSARDHRIVSTGGLLLACIALSVLAYLVGITIDRRRPKGYGRKRSSS